MPTRPRPGTMRAMRERDLFRAIVLSGAALASAPGCSSTPAATDSGTIVDAPAATPDAPVAETDAPTGTDTGVVMADAGETDSGTSSDAGDPDFDAGEDAMVLIL